MEQSARWEDTRGLAGDLARFERRNGRGARQALASPRPACGSAGWLAALVVVTLATAVAAVAAARGCGDVRPNDICAAPMRAQRRGVAGELRRAQARHALETLVFRDGGLGARPRPPARRRSTTVARAVAATSTPGRVVEGAALAGGGHGALPPQSRPAGELAHGDAHGYSRFAPALGTAWISARRDGRGALAAERPRLLAHTSSPRSYTSAAVVGTAGWRAPGRCRARRRQRY